MGGVSRSARALTSVAVFVGAVGVVGATPPAAGAQVTDAASPGAPDTLEIRRAPADTYADPAVRDLIERATLERAARARGLESFEVTFRERLYAGLGGRIIRRERAMFHQERAARVHWSADGERIVRWLGVRRGVPIAGLGVEFEDDPRSDDVFDLDFDFLDPAEDRVFLGDDWALHPLADTAGLHYRYRSGDTLRIRFPGSDRTFTLVEAVVEPREARFDRIVGSLWFDRDLGVLVRAAYRPAIDYDFDREEPEDAAEVPGFLRPLRATVDFITVDYGLQELRWWLPNRMAFDATAMAAGIASMPFRLEWTFDDYAVDEPQTIDPGEDAVPEGWTRWVEDGAEIVIADGDTLPAPADSLEAPADSLRAPADSLEAPPTRVVMIVPPIDSLVNSLDLPKPLFSGSVDAFDDQEIDQLRSRLGAIDVPGAPLRAPHLALGPWAGLIRFNRVEGFSPGARFAWPTGVSSRVELVGRIGVPEWEPGGDLRWVRETPSGTLGMGAYRRLTDLGDWGRPLGFGNSVNTLLTGYDDGLYFRQTGLEVFGSRTGSRTRWEGRLFAERHQTAPKTTDVSLPNAWSERLLPANVDAARGEIAGASGRVRVFSGVDPADPILSATVWAEAAAGDFDYGRAAASTALSTTLIGQWSAGLEVGAGTTFGHPPPQRLYHLGGPYTLRAFDPGAAFGESFWIARAELGRGFRVGETDYGVVGGSTFRVTAFGDAAWAGDRDAFGTEGWRASVGAGFSIMDGLLRFDIARAVRGAERWQLHIYADGLM